MLLGLDQESMICGTRICAVKMMSLNWQSNPLLGYWKNHCFSVVGGRCCTALLMSRHYQVRSSGRLQSVYSEVSGLVSTKFQKFTFLYNDQVSEQVNTKFHSLVIRPCCILLCEI